MPRYVNDVPTKMPVQHVMNQIQGYLQTEGFVQQPDGSWQKGMGFLTSPQFVFVAPGNNFVHVEAWIRFAILPGVYAGEMGIDGAFQFIPKRALKTRVQAIEAFITQQG